MSRSRRLPIPLVLLAAVFALASGTCHRGIPEPGRAERVVLVSFDGVGADLAQHWLDDGVMVADGGLAGMRREGLSVRRLRMANPTLTSVNHLCLASGELPSRTGVVSNVFHRPGTPITEMVNGFAADCEAETLWQRARRQGRRTGVLLWPGADGVGERRGDFGLVWPTAPLAQARAMRLEPADAVAGEGPPSSDGVVALGWRLEVDLGQATPGLTTVEAAALDGTPDGRPAYDRVAIRGPGGDWRQVEELGWFDLEVLASGPDDAVVFPYGAWSKVLAIDPLRGAVHLYRGAFYRVVGYPESFRRRVEQELGFWPGPPDDPGLGRRWLDPDTGIDIDTYLEQVERFDRYLDQVALQVLENEEFDLLLAYHSTPDEYQHAALIADERQLAYSPGAAATSRQGMDRVGRSVDRSVATLWQALDPARDALVVVSDHGHLPTHDQVNVNQALAEAGLLDIDTSSGRPRPAATSRVVAFASGACAHLYLNLRDREPGGVVVAADADELLRRAAKALADLEVEGEPVVERIVTRAEAAELGLDHPAAGDLVVFLRPGYATGWQMGDAVLEPSQVLGQHGHLNHHDALCGIFLARGAGVPRARVREADVREVAPLVAALLDTSL